MQVPLLLRRLPRVEEVALHLVMSCQMTLDLVMGQQWEVFEELGQTRENRDALVEQVASQGYRRGLLSFPRRLLPLLLSEHDLQDLFLLCAHQTPRHEIVDRCTRILTQRPEIPYACDPMPQVSRDERRTDRRASIVRTRRDPRRTRRCDERPVPEHGMSP